MSSPAPWWARLTYVVRHVGLLLFCLAMLGANLTEGPVDAVLQPTFGIWLERVGLRQYWSMFAPNPVHWGSFTRAYAVSDEGRVELPISVEPPWDRPFFRLGYDRILKFQKKVNVDRGRYARAYAESLCRVYDVRGSVELEKVMYYTPTPSKRLEGWGRMRLPESLGTWRCQ